MSRILTTLALLLTLFSASAYAQVVAQGAPGNPANPWNVRITGYPTATAVADGTANPTLTQIQTFQMVWNIDAATWFRQVQYADGDLSVTKRGSLVMGENGGGIIRTVRVNDDGGVVVNQGVTSGTPWAMYIASPDGANAADVVAGQGLQVFSTDFDIRNLAFATDKVDVTGSSVVVSSSALPVGAATAALQTQPGVDIGDVTVNNASGAGAVNIQDGGNSITVDATALPLPTGAATSALQTTGNTSLNSIDSKFPATAALADGTANPTLTKIQVFPSVWNGVNAWQRASGGGLSADGITSAGIIGAADARDFGHLFNGTSWDRWQSGSLGADGQIATTTGNANVRGFLFGWNGSFWDRVRTGSIAADNISTSTTGNLQTMGFNFVWDSAGGNWDRWATTTTEVTRTTSLPGVRALRTAGDITTIRLDTLNEVFTVSAQAGDWETCTLSITSNSLVGTAQLFAEVASGTGFQLARAVNTQTGVWFYGTLPAGDAQYILPCAGFRQFQLIITAYTSGIIDVSGAGGPGTQAVIANVTGSVSITGSVATTGSFEDNDLFTFNTTKVQPIGAVVDDTFPTSVTEDSAGAPRMSTNRNLYTQIRDAAGNERGAFVTNLNALSVDTELAIVTATDSFFNPDAAQVLSFGMTWDTLNSKWNRLRGQTNTLPSGGTVTSFGGYTQIYNGSSWDWALTAANALNSTGAGIATAQSIAQFDDVSPTAITENRFGNLRMSANRNLFGTIRDAAGNERGVNVTAGNALTVDGSAVTQPISGTVTANAGTNLNTSALALDATLTNRFPAGANPADNESNTSSQSRIGAYGFIFDGSTWDRWTGAVTQGGTWNIGTVTTVTAVTAITNALPAGNNNIGDVDLASAIPTGSNIIGRVGIDQTTPGTTNKVSLGTDTVTTKELRAATPAVTSVAGSASSVTCLALNANRLGATIYNDSTADLYIKLGATASVTSFTVKVFQDGFFTVPFGYTGVIDCIWASATGNARVTEVTQ